MLLQVIILSLARFIEAIRDGEAFRDPTKDRSVLWHILKFPQYGLIALFGVSSWPIDYTTGSGILLSIGVAHVIFEIALKFYRKK